MRDRRDATNRGIALAAMVGMLVGAVLAFVAGQAR